jgi:hypothetical protein
MNLSVEADTNPLKRKRAEGVPLLPYCDAWRRTFSAAEGLRALLSREGCFMSDICGIRQRTPKKDEGCRICWHLGINSHRYYRHDGVPANFTRTGCLSIDDTTSNEPLRNIKPQGKWQRIGAISVTERQSELWSRPEAKELEVTII